MTRPRSHGSPACWTGTARSSVATRRQIRRSVQVRFDGDAEGTLRTIQGYAAVGVGDVILMLPPGLAQEHAELAVDLLPRLRELG